MKTRARLLFVLLLAAMLNAPLQSQEASSLESLLAEAQAAQARSDYRTAASYYQKATELEPRMAKLWANLGLMQHGAGDYTGSIHSLQHAHAIDPSLYVPNLFLGLDDVRIGKPKEAIQWLLKAEAMNAKDTEPPLALGNAYLSLGDYDAAARQFETAVRRGPDAGPAWFGMGMAHLNQVEGASRELASVKGDSVYRDALYAESLTRQGRLMEAADLFQSILKASEQPPCMRSELGFVYLQEKQDAKAEAQFAAERASASKCDLNGLGEARRRIDSAEFGQAVELVQDLWQLDPGFLRAHAALLLAGSSADSVAAFHRSVAAERAAGRVSAGLDELLSATDGAAIAVNDQSVGSQASSKPAQDAARTFSQRNAQREFADGRYGECAASLRGGLESMEAAGLRLLAACSFMTGDYELSSTASRSLLHRSPGSREGMYWSVKANEELAFGALARFQQLEPDSARSHLLLGDIYRQRSRFSDAEAEYKAALRLSPRDTGALLGLARSYLGNANPDKAIETARLALEQTPDDPEVNLVLGEAMVSRHEFAGAEPFLQKALNAKPQLVPHVHALLGEVYFETGRASDAIRELKLGADTDQDGSLHYKLARMYLKVGDKADAEIALRQVKAIEQLSRDRATTMVKENEVPRVSDDSPTNATRPQ